MGIARKHTSQQVPYARKTITYADNGSEIDIVTIPAGSVLHQDMSGVAVTTPFNASAGNVLQFGTSDGSDDPNLYGTSLALGTAGFVPVDVAVSGLVTVDTTISVTIELTGTAATAGSAEVIVCWIPDNDG